MPLRTKVFTLDPWVGGLNTSLDESTIPNNQLTRCENWIFDTRGSKKKREGVDSNWDNATSSVGDSIIGLHDFRFGLASRTQNLVSVSKGNKVYSYVVGGGSDGNRTDITGSAAFSVAPTQVTMATFTNLLIIGSDSSSNVLKKWTGTGNIANLGGSPVAASIVREYLGRLWTNDLTNLDRIHYCTTGNAEEWNGTGDSGAIDIGVGDGDPDGITAIFPFKGTLFVFKRRRIYRVSGFTPETFKIEIVSRSIGCVGPNAIVGVDNDDVYFVSDRGVHSLITTANFGDFKSSFKSKDIQKSITDEWSRSRLAFIQAAYLPTINSVAFCVTEADTSINQDMWLYNIEIDAWYRWPDLECESITTSYDSDKIKFYLGRTNERVTETFTGNKFDTDSAGATAGFDAIVQTGIIKPEGNIYGIKGFKKVAMIIRPEGTVSVTANFRVDNLPDQAVSFSQTTSGDLLGSTFILGTSTLSATPVLVPLTSGVDGYGRGFKLRFTHSNKNEDVEIQGFIVEFESAGTSQENISGG